MPDFVRDYGPLREFWTFLFERLNKVLKSYKTGNHAGGELEVSFFREFQRTIRTSALVSPAIPLVISWLTCTQVGQGFQSPPDSPLHHSVAAMYRATADDRGTIQGLARELDEAHGDGKCILESNICSI